MDSNSKIGFISQFIIFPDASRISAPQKIMPFWKAPEAHDGLGTIPDEKALNEPTTPNCPQEETLMKKVE